MNNKKKYVIGYCFKCAENTKHEVIECHNSTAYRAFETIATFGFGLLLPHNYECECTRCGKINTIEK